MAVTPNRGYVYPDEGVDDWYATFVALMNALDADIQASVSLTPLTDIIVKKSDPALRFQGQEASAVEFRMVEIAGALYVQKNIGTAANPVWTSLWAFTSGGDLVGFQAGKGVAMETPDGNNVVRVSVDNDGTIKEASYP